MSYSKQWYPVNSLIIHEIRPSYREPGGGVTRKMMFDTKKEAIEQCIIYLGHRIDEARHQIKELEKELNDEEMDRQ